VIGADSTRATLATTKPAAAAYLLLPSKQVAADSYAKLAEP
jgi:hypothetical protein